MGQGMGRSWRRDIVVCEEVLLVGGVFLRSRDEEIFLRYADPRLRGSEGEKKVSFEMTGWWGRSTKFVCTAGVKLVRQIVEAIE
jgi:hypothetical protein